MLLISNPVYEITRMVMAIAVREAPLEYQCHFGTGSLANLVARDATQMYASNMFNLVEDTWDTEAKQFVLDMENDILPGCVITHGGAVVHPTIKNIIEGAG